MTVQITVAIPSFNQGVYLQSTLDSVYAQDVSLEICIADGGSTDESVQVIEHNRNRLRWYQSAKDEGQSNAVNIAVKNGSAPYICWLNSDDVLAKGALKTMVSYLDANPAVPAVYGKGLYIDAKGTQIGEYFTQPFSWKTLSRRCVVCQPAVLIRRSVWESLGGLDESLHMSMDYDLWWRIYTTYGEMEYLNNYFAKSRLHKNTKTNSFRKAHYRESISIVKKYTKHISWYWYIKWPWSVWYKTIRNKIT